MDGMRMGGPNTDVYTFVNHITIDLAYDILLNLYGTRALDLFVGGLDLQGNLEFTTGLLE